MFFEGLSCIAVVGGLKEFATVLSIASFLIPQLHKVMINVKDESWRLTRSELPCGFQLHHHDSPWGFIDLLFWCWLATFGLERTGAGGRMMWCILKNRRKDMTGESPSTPISHGTWLLGGFSVDSYTDFTIVFADVWERDERSRDDGSSSVPKKLTESKALSKTSVLSENRPSPKKILFQPWIFRCYVSFREANLWSLLFLMSLSIVICILPEVHGKNFNESPPDMIHPPGDPTQHKYLNFYNQIPHLQKWKKHVQHECRFSCQILGKKRVFCQTMDLRC